MHDKLEINTFKFKSPFHIKGISISLCLELFEITNDTTPH